MACVLTLLSCGLQINLLSGLAPQFTRSLGGNLSCCTMAVLWITTPANSLCAKGLQTLAPYPRLAWQTYSDWIPGLYKDPTGRGSCLSNRQLPAGCCLDCLVMLLCFLTWPYLLNPLIWPLGSDEILVTDPCKNSNHFPRLLFIPIDLPATWPPVHTLLLWTQPVLATGRYTCRFGWQCHLGSCRCH